MANLLNAIPLERRTYLTAEEAAVYLGYRTVKAFRSYARRKNVTPCRDGRRVTWLRADLDKRHQRNLRAVRGFSAKSVSA